tara:strand:+ start:196 stop:456 length:261 start_codon:yes stop_codon:yes gene_type:complete
MSTELLLKELETQAHTAELSKLDAAQLNRIIRVCLIDAQTETTEAIDLVLFPPVAQGLLNKLHRLQRQLSTIQRIQTIQNSTNEPN